MAAPEPPPAAPLPPAVRRSADGPGRGAIPALPWSVQAVELVSTYLPLLLMGLLALGTWWLVKNSPSLEPPSTPRAPVHVPDYTMSGFSTERFSPDGRLRVRIEGAQLRHYPDTDTVEVDQPRIQVYAADGRRTVATARTAVSNGDGSEIQLIGDAQVVRAASAREAETEFRGEFLHAFLATEELRSHLPVTVRRGGTELRGDALDYRHRDQVVQLKGRVRAVLPPPGAAAAAQR